MKWHRDVSPLGQDTTVQGWVRSVGRQEGLTFIEVDDGSSLKPLQVVVDEHKAGEAAVRVTAGCGVRVAGKVVKSTHAADRVMLAATTIDVVGPCDPSTYPLRRKASDVEL